jgi:hypothetical protein
MMTLLAKLVHLNNEVSRAPLRVEHGKARRRLNGGASEQTHA